MEPPRTRSTGLRDDYYPSNNPAKKKFMCPWQSLKWGGRAIDSKAGPWKDPSSCRDGTERSGQAQTRNLKCGDRCVVRRPRAVLFEGRAYTGVRVPSMHESPSVRAWHGTHSSAGLGGRRRGWEWRRGHLPRLRAPGAGQRGWTW